MGNVRRMKQGVGAADAWRRVGSCADCDMLARGVSRRLVDRDGTVVIEVELSS